jgi:predicted phosphodiesterase
MKKINKILVLTFLIVIMLFTSGCEAEPLSLSSIKDEAVISMPISKDINSGVQLTEPPRFYSFEGNELGSLEIKRLVLTPSENPSHGIGITFNMDHKLQDVSIIVIDEDKQFVDEFGIDISNLQIDDDGKMKELYIYKTTITELEALSTYQFAIKSNNDYSKLYEITTLSESEPTIMAFFGDTQGYKLSQYENFRITYEKAIDVVGQIYIKVDMAGTDKIGISYIAGDIVDRGDSWDQWGFLDEAMAGYMSNAMFVTTIGNHDVKQSPDIYTHTFNYPENGIDGGSERSYYFDLPYGRVAVWDSEAISTFEEQSQWLLDIMSQDEVGFKLVLMHRSAYPMAYDEGHIRRLSEVFEKAEIDLVLSGHDHIYSRTTMFQDKQVPIDKGVTYIVGGSSTGSKFYDTLQQEKRYWKNISFDGDYPVFTLLNIGETSIQVNAYAIEDEVALIDHFEITK